MSTNSDARSTAKREETFAREMEFLFAVNRQADNNVMVEAVMQVARASGMAARMVSKNAPGANPWGLRCDAGVPEAAATMLSDAWLQGYLSAKPVVASAAQDEPEPECPHEYCMYCANEEDEEEEEEE